MADAILVPQVGQDLTEAKVVALHVKLGDTVKKGDIVAEVESEKASFEVEAFAAGTVIALPYKQGDTATVLQPLVVLGKPGEKADKTQGAAPAVASAAQADAPPAAKSKSPAAASTARSDGGLRSSPLARRLAAKSGLDIGRLSGSGPKGAIVQRDIEAALSAGGGRAMPRMPVAGNAGSQIAIRGLKPGIGDPVMFIHGFGSDLSIWRPFIARVAIANPMLGLDLPAHGGSLGQATTGFEAIVEDVAAALASNGHMRLHLVGHSLGAAVAASLADRGFEVRSLTLIAPAGLGPKINGDFFAGFLDAGTEPALRVWLHSLVHDPKSLPDAMVRATIAARDGTGLAEGQKRLATSLFSGITQLFSIRDALARYEGPCRVIVGREDGVIPSAQADNLPAHVALHRLPGVGHLPYLEAAGLVGRLVAETVRAAG